MPGLRQHIFATAGLLQVGSIGSKAKAPAGRAAAGDASGEQSITRLVSTLEKEIIPRLRLASACAADGAADGETAPSLDDEVAVLAELVVRRNADAATAFVGEAHARGVPVETLCLDLLAPAARHLGELWAQDLCGFEEVTLGLCRLHQVLRESSSTLSWGCEPSPGCRRALLVPSPGEQHSFGVLMVVEFFRRDGWDVWSSPPTSAGELREAVRNEWFDVAGLSLSHERQLDTLAASIRAIRRASCNRAIGIIVGGNVFIEHPEYAPLVGADATAADGRQAVRQASDLLALLA